MIKIINNQPIILRDSNTIDGEPCKCHGQLYCQLIEKNDETQFQIKVSNEVLNGEFAIDLNSWNVYLAIIIELTTIINPNVSTCDGSVTVSVIGGTGPYEFSIDGGAYVTTTTFSSLCSGFHFIIAKDSLGNQGAIEFILSAIDCADFADATTNELLFYYTNQIINCTTNDFL